MSYFQVFNLFWLGFCLGCKIGVQFHSFACSHPVLWTSFIEETILPSAGWQLQKLGLQMCTQAPSRDTLATWSRPEGECGNSAHPPLHSQGRINHPDRCAKLEAWPSGSSFWSLQIGHFQGKTRRYAFLSAPFVQSPELLARARSCESIKSSLFSVDTWVSWTQALVAFRARCSFLRWKS